MSKMLEFLHMAYNMWPHLWASIVTLSQLLPWASVVAQ